MDEKKDFIELVENIERMRIYTEKVVKEFIKIAEELGRNFEKSAIKLSEVFSEVDLKKILEWLIKFEENEKSIMTFLDEKVINPDEMETIEEFFDAFEKWEAERKKSLPKVTSKKPLQALTTIDKVSNYSFDKDKNPDFYKYDKNAVALERRGSKEHIDTIVSINLDNMIEVHSSVELTPFDREVHDAVVTLMVEGKNEYITPQMIYQTMTGKDKKGSAGYQIIESISTSISKMMYSKLSIDATEEAKKYGFNAFKYNGYLLPAEMATAVINGTKLECIHLFRVPPLYDYANRKNQIGRLDIKLLDSPVNKNEETIILQGYLYRRVISKGLSPNIVYATIYDYLGLKESSRNKKMQVRKKTKEILEYWKQQCFIEDYIENIKNREAYSVTVIRRGVKNV